MNVVQVIGFENVKIKHHEMTILSSSTIKIENMKIYDYKCKLRHKTFHSNACYHIFLVFIYHSMKKSL